MILIVYFRLYLECLVRALGAIARSAWTLVLPMGLMVAWVLLATLLSGLGFVGGILAALARTAAASAYWYFVSELVAGNRVSINEFKRSIGAYFWSFLNLFFVLWILDLVLGMVLQSNPKGAQLMVIIDLMELVVLNAAPEVIAFKRSYGGLETIQRSFQFLQESWIEWFVPNGLVIFLVWWLSWGGGQRFLAMIPGGQLTFAVVAGVLLHVFFVFRGYLFETLNGTSHRQRMFKYRLGKS